MNYYHIIVLGDNRLIASEGVQDVRALPLKKKSLKKVERLKSNSLH
jgi:hypothetical protein